MKHPLKLSPAEYSTVVWHHDMPAGQTIEDALKPEYWTHVTSQLRPGHEIKIVSEDRTLWAHLLVRDVGKMEAQVAVIQKVSFKAVEEIHEGAEFVCKWRSPGSKFGVFRVSDGECVQDQFETKEAAQRWVLDRSKSMAA